jgi:hypothetical protein
LFIEHFGWRGACVAWAVLRLVIGLPMNRLLIPRAVPQAPETTLQREATPAGIPFERTGETIWSDGYDWHYSSHD